MQYKRHGILYMERAWAHPVSCEFYVCKFYFAVLIVKAFKMIVLHTLVRALIK